MQRKPHGYQAGNLRRNLIISAVVLLVVLTIGRLIVVDYLTVDQCIDNEGYWDKQGNTCIRYPDNSGAGLKK